MSLCLGGVRHPRYPHPCQSPPSNSLFSETRQARFQGPAQENAPWDDVTTYVAGASPRGVFYSALPPPTLERACLQQSCSPHQDWPPAVLGDRPFAFDFVGGFQNISPSEISRECTLYIVIQSRMSTGLILNFLKVIDQRTRRQGGVARSHLPHPGTASDVTCRGHVQ